MGCQIDLIMIYHGLMKITNEVNFRNVSTQKFFLFIQKKLLLNNLRLVGSFIDLKTVNYIYSTTLNQR
jgi:hypothetical protein